MPNVRARKRRWMCKNNHPLGRSKNGTIVCYHCSRFAQLVRTQGLEMGACHLGHARPVGAKTCPVCDDWRRTPWHRQLDETGRAVCPKGHPLEPFNGSLTYTARNRRICTACSKTWSASIHQARRATNYEGFDKHGRNGLCAGQKHPWSDDIAEEKVDHRGRLRVNCILCRRERVNARNWATKIAVEKRTPLADDHLDWVLVHKLVTQGSEGLVYHRRGVTLGPTVAEKWVAYCTWKTINKREPLDNGFVPEQHFIRWRDEGKAKGFAFLDLWGLTSAIGTPAYAKGRLIYEGV